MTSNKWTPAPTLVKKGKEIHKEEEEEKWSRYLMKSGLRRIVLGSAAETWRWYVMESILKKKNVMKSGLKWILLSVRLNQTETDKVRKNRWSCENFPQKYQIA